MGRDGYTPSGVPHYASKGKHYSPRPRAPRELSDYEQAERISKGQAYQYVRNKIRETWKEGDRFIVLDNGDYHSRFHGKQGYFLRLHTSGGGQYTDWVYVRFDDTPEGNTPRMGMFDFYRCAFSLDEVDIIEEQPEPEEIEPVEDKRQRGRPKGSTNNKSLNIPIDAEMAEKLDALAFLKSQGLSDIASEAIHAYLDSFPEIEEVIEMKRRLRGEITDKPKKRKTTRAKPKPAPEPEEPEQEEEEQPTEQDLTSPVDKDYTPPSGVSGAFGMSGFKSGFKLEDES